MNIGVVIGRFQFFHLGHLALIENALSQVDHLVLAIGSVAIAPTSRNPFSFVERVEHIKKCFPDAPISFVGIHDHPDSNHDWVDEVIFKVNQQRLDSKSVTLFGNKKDDTAWYMDLYKERGWSVKDYEGDTKITGTNVRDRAYCNGRYPETPIEWKSDVPEALHEVFSTWLTSPAGKSRGDEYVAECLYQLPYVSLPFPPIFHTIDSIVTCQGHILLVKRGKLRGKGLYALPGGFLNHNEHLIDGAIRELYEETTLGVPEPVIKASWTGATVTLDNPNRSLIGRIISEVFHFQLPYDICPGDTLPPIKGADDAEEAVWMPLEKLHGNYYKDMDVIRPQFFEDHLFCIKQMLSNIEAIK